MLRGFKDQSLIPWTDDLRLAPDRDSDFVPALLRRPQGRIDSAAGRIRHRPIVTRSRHTSPPPPRYRDSCRRGTPTETPRWNAGPISARGDLAGRLKRSDKSPTPSAPLRQRHFLGIPLRGHMFIPKFTPPCSPEKFERRGPVYLHFQSALLEPTIHAPILCRPYRPAYSLASVTSVAFAAPIAA